MSLYNLAYEQCRRHAHKADALVWPHLWVLCDGKDKNRTAYLSASFRSTKQSCLQSSFVGNKYSNGSLQPDEKEVDQWIAAGYVITTQGIITLHVSRAGEAVYCFYKHHGVRLCVRVCVCTVTEKLLIRKWRDLVTISVVVNPRSGWMLVIYDLNL